MRAAVCCLGLVLTQVAPAQDRPAKGQEVPPEVAVVQPVVRDVTDYAEFSGRVEPSATVQLRVREVGLLEKVLFKEGSEVKKGDVLCQLDDRVQRAGVAVAEAELSRAEARLKLADMQRQRTAAAKDLASREEIERALAAADEAKAGVLAAKAAVELARIKLEDTR